jgi:hypothetical protein
VIRPRAFALAGAYLLRGAVDAARAAIYSTSVDCCQAMCSRFVKSTSDRTASMLFSLAEAR